MKKVFSIKFLRSILVMLLICAMVVSMAGCGKSGDNSSDGGNSSGGNASSSEMNSGESGDASEQSGEASGQTDDGSGNQESSSDGSGEESGEEPVVAVKELNCIAEITRIESIVLGDNDIAAIGYWERGEIGFDPYICVVDLKEDKLLSSSQQGEDFGMPVGVTAQGQILTRDYDEGFIHLLDQDLHLVKTFEIKSTKAVYSREEECVYVANWGLLTKLSLNGDTETVLEFHNWTIIQEIDPVSKTVLVKALAESETGDERYELHSFSGELLFAIEAQNVQYLIADGWLVGHYFDFTNWEDDTIPDPLGCYDPSSGYTGTGYAISKQMDPTGLSGTALMAAKQDVIISNTEVNTKVFLLDITTGQLILVRKFEDSRQMAVARDITTGKVYFAMAGAGGGCILVVEPSALDMSEQLEHKDLPEAAEPFVKAEIGDHLAQARAYADEIEAKYNVTILLSEEARGIGFTGYELGYTSELEPAEEAEVLMTGLEMLDIALSAYPEGFFDFFHQDDGRGGVRFVFYSSLSKEDEQFTAGGVQAMVGAWYNVAFDSRTLQLSVIHHELFHAVENRCAAENVNMIESEWDALNPEDFQYGYDLSAYWQNDYARWTIGTAEKEETYFVRDYSTVNAKEDRATIMEFLLRDHSWWRFEYEFYQTLPHLYAKLQYMEQKVGEAFGYVYWLVMMENE